MRYDIDFSIATSDQIQFALCQRLEKIRLMRNMTQARLAQEAGLSQRTIIGLERGEGVSFDTFIRVLIALGIQQNLESLLPDPTIRPIDRVKGGGIERQRASPERPAGDRKAWTWGDEIADEE